MCLCLAVTTDNQASYFAKKERTSKLPFLTTATPHARLSYTHPNMDIHSCLHGGLFIVLFWVFFSFLGGVQTSVPQKHSSWFSVLTIEAFIVSTVHLLHVQWKERHNQIIRLCIWRLGCNASLLKSLSEVWFGYIMRYDSISGTWESM